uniref:signal-recognition-particle GTPase n=3 Tax=Ditylum brightwellii TaxID=49249 RepID=A0A6S9H5E0_9STRA
MTEASISAALKDVRRALLDADVNVKVADALIEGVKKRSIGIEVSKGVTADQQFIKAMYDELLDMMGGDSSVDKNKAPQSSQNVPAATLAVGTVSEPAVVLLAGLQGAGKTTAAGKLALYLKEREVDYDAVAAMDPEESAQLLTSRMPTRKRKVLLAAADVYRPAAIKQLQVLGESIGVTVFSMGTEADPVDIAAAAVQKAKDEGYDTVLVDTAGRQVIDAELMDELRRIKETVNPDETLLVVDAMTGQEAASLTAAFDNAVGISGAILTKLDGDSRGGAAVSVRGVSGKPIKFVGTGEKTPDLEPFYPDRMASRILGMGDVISLVEKAAAEVSDADAAKMQKKMMDASFDFDDFLKQTSLVSKMGSLAGVAKMIPGMAGALSNSKMNEVEKRMKKNEAMINSMTKKERANPELLLTDRSGRSRVERIAKGAGLPFEEGVQFMSEFQKMRTMMSRMQKQMGGGGMGGEEEMAMAGGGMPPTGNRASRRKAKKVKKGGRGGGGGFGR